MACQSSRARIFQVSSHGYINVISWRTQSRHTLYLQCEKMRRYLAIYVIGFLSFSGLVAVQVTAQESAQERAANLRAQLIDTEAKQAELQMRLQQLAEDLKPENIERSLAGVGSTHPEDLREARRRQLEIQKKASSPSSISSPTAALACKRLSAAPTRRSIGRM